MVFAAMLPWQFFATSLTESSASLIGNANLISKVYFPRLIVPAGAVITSFVDFLITVVLLAAMMVWYRFWPDWHILALPFFCGTGVCVLDGLVGLWLCALNGGIPRLSLHRSLYCAVWTLSVARWFQQRRDTGQMAVENTHWESNGRRH